MRELVAGANTQPTWSPNGRRIAFERGGDIRIAHATGAPRDGPSAGELGARISSR